MRTFLRPTLVLALLLVSGLATVGPLHAEEGAPAAARETASAGQVNVNTASAEELAMLPHVGPSTAQRIVAHRESNGAFKSVDDLLLVQGIGDKTYADMKPYVALSGKTTLSSKVKSSRAKG